MKIQTKKIHSFTKHVSGGNPAGVVTNTPIDITDIQMKHVTKELQVSETAFVFPSEKADFKTRFFSPETEVDLCGHATIAAFFDISKREMIPKNKNHITLTQETKVGILPVDLYFKNNRCEKVMMTQAKPMLQDVPFDYDAIAQSLCIEKDAIDASLPQQLVSTGLFELPVCIRKMSILQNMKPDFTMVKNLCTRFGVGSVHVFTFETIEPSSTYHARNFAPLYGIDEDPVTGTANGATCWYLEKNKIINGKDFICEQGDIIGRAGRVNVEIQNNIVMVGGSAVLAEKRELDV